ncbi:hypothetical protein ACFY36_18965 [Actinoplanes sp. NPDC000266]
MQPSAHAEPTLPFAQPGPSTLPYAQVEPTPPYVQAEHTPPYVQAEPTPPYVQAEPTQPFGQPGPFSPPFVPAEPPTEPQPYAQAQAAWTMPGVAAGTPGPVPGPPPPRRGVNGMIVALAVGVFLLLVTGGTIVALRSDDGTGGTPAAQQQQDTGQAANADPGVPVTPEPEATFTDPAPTAGEPETTYGEAGPAGAPPAGAAPEETSPTAVATTPLGAGSEQAAVAQLEQIWRDDASTISFQGQYAAQIATKYPGIVDNLQTTVDGSHTFMASDILAEHRGLRDAHGSAGHPVVLIKSTDYGKRQKINGHFLWGTFAVGHFADAGAVHAWCEAQFAELTAAKRANQCVPRRLNPGR